MPPKRHFRERRNVGLDESAQRVLTTGSDSFREFAGDAGRLLLAELWGTHGGILTAAHIAVDPTTRPAAWFWWTSPANLRIEYPKTLLKTEQRQALIRSHVLSGAALILAEQRNAAWKKSGVVMLLWDLRTH